MNKVLNFGSLNLDYVYHVDHFVRPGETLSAVSQTVNPGGKGLNQSCALARAGVRVFHAGCAGTGGELLLDTLRAHGVDTSFLLSVDVHQGNAIIQVDRSGENAILLFGGSNQCVTERQVTETLAAFGPGDILLLQNEINNLPLIVERASERGMSIVLNPSPYDRKLEAVDFSRLSWLFVNEVEGEQLAGSPAPEEIWRQIHRKYPGLSVLVTLGKQGSAAYRVSGDTVETAVQEAFPVDAVDTTAAGDTYTGFFIAAMAEGRALKDCMRLAAAASAICVTRHGAAASIPSREEAESFCAM